MSCKPILKWVGGKTQIMEEVFSHFPLHINNYYEPFVGGGSVMIELLNRLERGEIEVSGRIHISDYNLDLIRLYQEIQNSPNELIEALAGIKGEYESCPERKIESRKIKYPIGREEALTSKELYYYYIRQEYNGVSQHPILKSAYFLFLNKTSFRGLYRIGPKGFNVPYGNYKNPSIFSPDEINQLSTLMKKYEVIIEHFSFESVIGNPAKFVSGDFIYLDPPYVPESETSFVGYVDGGFDEAKHRELFSYLSRLETSFVLSNSDTPMLYEYFENEKYQMKKISVRRAIKAKDPSATTMELIIKR